jgi:hypothetical protein
MGYSFAVSKHRKGSVPYLYWLSSNASHESSDIIASQGISDIQFDLGSGFATHQNRVHPFSGREAPTIDACFAPLQKQTCRIHHLLGRCDCSGIARVKKPLQ